MSVVEVYKKNEDISHVPLGAYLRTRTELMEGKEFFTEEDREEVIGLLDILRNRKIEVYDEEIFDLAFFLAEENSEGFEGLEELEERHRKYL